MTFYNIIRPSIRNFRCCPWRAVFSWFMMFSRVYLFIAFLFICGPIHSWNTCRRVLETLSGLGSYLKENFLLFLSGGFVCQSRKVVWGYVISSLLTWQLSYPLVGLLLHRDLYGIAMHLKDFLSAAIWRISILSVLYLALFKGSFSFYFSTLLSGLLVMENRWIYGWISGWMLLQLISCMLPVFLNVWHVWWRLLSLTNNGLFQVNFQFPFQLWQMKSFLSRFQLNLRRIY